jgi:hypothetical protein
VSISLVVSTYILNRKTHAHAERVELKIKTSRMIDMYVFGAIAPILTSLTFYLLPSAAAAVGQAKQGNGGLASGKMMSV